MIAEELVVFSTYKDLVRMLETIYFVKLYILSQYNFLTQETNKCEQHDNEQHSDKR